MSHKMDSDVRKYIEKEGEIYIDDFMTGDDDEDADESSQSSKMNGEEFNALKAKFDFGEIFTNLQLSKNLMQI